MAIEIKLQAPEIGEVEVDGEVISVVWDGSFYDGGRFKATYHGRFFNSPTLEVIRNGVRGIRDDEAWKARKEQARKEAAKNPPPAVAVLGREERIERVGVRGRHATSKEALVTFANGSKGSVDPAYLLRDLTADEYAQVEEAAAARPSAGATGRAPEDAERYLALHAVMSARTEEFKTLLREFRFDLSIFAD